MTEIAQILPMISPIAVIAGTILVVLQLRVNAKQAKARNAFDLIGKVIDPSFPIRRHLLYEVAQKHAGGNWAGFDHTLEDFQGGLCLAGQRESRPRSAHAPRVIGLARRFIAFLIQSPYQALDSPRL